MHLYIRGNCGNQFFQYAFARYIQEKIGGDLVINYFRVREDKNILEESDNLLKLFNTVPYRYETRPGFGGFIFRCLKLIHKIFHLESFQERTYRFYLWCAKVLPRFGIYYFDAAYYPFQISNRKNIYINGYFESPRYFEDIDDKICTELSPKEPGIRSNTDFYNEIINSESVCVTLKRKDTDNEKYNYSISYFYTAMDYIKDRVENPIFFIFSDDIEWCKNNIHGEYSLRFEKPGNPIWEKVRLMSACKHFVIYNSTFSWWVQHLSAYSDKIVIAPSIWMVRYDQPVDIYEDNWLYLDSEGTVMDCHERY